MTKTVSRRWIYLPVEVKSRELLAKVLLAAVAVKSDFGVFIGRNGMNISRDTFPRGIYFDKCLSSHKSGFHDYQVNTLGNKLVSLDEEGLLIPSEESYEKNRVTNHSLRLSSCVFFWGDNQKKIFSSFPEIDKKGFVTGSPKIDIWRPDFSLLYKKELDRLNQVYGDFILVVSNWGYHEHEKKMGLNPDQSYSFQTNMTSAAIFRTNIRQSFIQLIQQLAKQYPSQTIIVRPHPLDMTSYWNRMRKVFSSNVTVISEGSITPWIRAAKVVIHNNCTTGLESWISSVKTIAYCPSIEGFNDFNIYSFPINSLGLMCRSEKEVIDTINAHTEHSSNTKSDSLGESTIRKFIFSDDKELASERIVNYLKELDIAPAPYVIQRFGARKKLRVLAGRIKWKLRDFFGLTGMYTLSYTHQKNPGITHDELKDLLTNLSPIVGLEDSFFQIEEVDQDTFCIFKGKN